MDEKSYTGGHYSSLEPINCMKKILSKWLIQYWIHVIAWISLMLYETVLVGIAFGAFGHPVTYLAHYSINILYFYFITLVGLPWATSRSKQISFRIPVLFLMIFCLYVLIQYTVDSILISNQIITHIDHVFLDKSAVLKAAYRYIYFAAFAVAYFFMQNYIIEKKRASELETERLKGLIKEEQISRLLEKAKNDFLRAQINPHFLFNTLNFIYNSVHDNPDEAGEAILILSEIMRYAVEGQFTPESDILLSDELGQIEKLLYLYQLRTRQSNINLVINSEVSTLRLIPLILLTLMENIFKHANLGRSANPAQMIIAIENAILQITTSNLINHTERKNGTNIGLQNIRDRLKNAYGSSVSFISGTNAEGYFVVNIRIPLHVINLNTHIHKHDVNLSNVPISLVN